MKTQPKVGDMIVMTSNGYLGMPRGTVGVVLGFNIKNHSALIKLAQEKWIVRNTDMRLLEEPLNIFMDIICSK